MGGDGVLRRWPDTKRYKETRYSLKLIGLAGGVVEVFRDGSYRPLMHLLTRGKLVSETDSLGESLRRANKTTEVVFGEREVPRIGSGNERLPSLVPIAGQPREKAA